MNSVTLFKSKMKLRISYLRKNWILSSPPLWKNKNLKPTSLWASIAKENNYRTSKLLEKFSIRVQRKQGRKISARKYRSFLELQPKVSGQNQTFYLLYDFKRKVRRRKRREWIEDIKKLIIRIIRIYFLTPTLFILKMFNMASLANLCLNNRI